MASEAKPSCSPLQLRPGFAPHRRCGLQQRSVERDASLSNAQALSKKKPTSTKKLIWVFMWAKSKITL
jgi:hypothetical protein